MNAGLDPKVDTPYAMIEVATSQSISNSAWTSVSYETVVEDNEGLTTEISRVESARFGAIFIKRPGRYLLSADAVMGANSTGSRVCRFAINDVQGYAGKACLTPTIAMDFSLAKVVRLRAGDKVQFQVWQNSGGSLNVTSGDFSLSWLGP